MINRNIKNGQQKLISRATGKIKIEKNYLDGKLSGKYIYYWDNGQKRFSGYYIKSRRVGHWITFDHNGNIILEEDYDNSVHLLKAVKEKNYQE